jgi:hypothetical protein
MEGAGSPQQWWDALKYGIIGLTALIALWTASLLTFELRREKIRDSARKLIATFMVFAFALLVFAGSIHIYEESILRKKEALWSAVERHVAMLDGYLDEKAAAESEPEALKRLMGKMCSEIVEIYSATRWKAPRSSCVARFPMN